MARSLIAEETRQRLQGSDPRWKSKAILRTLAIFLDIITLVLFVVSIVMTVHWGKVWNDGLSDDWTDGMPLAPIIISLIYNPTVLFLLLRHRRGRLYHPGWDICFDLLIWVLSIPSIVYSVRDGWFKLWQPVMLEFGPDDYIPCNNRFNFWSEPCQPDIYTIGKIEVAANIFLALILFIHFSLFVLACMAMQKRRREATKAVAERRNIELQYHRSPEEHRARSYPMGDHDKDIEANNGALALKDIEANNGAPAVKYA